MWLQVGQTIGFTPSVRGRRNYLPFPKKIKFLNGLRHPGSPLPDKRNAKLRGERALTSATNLELNDDQLLPLLDAAYSMRNVRVTCERLVSNAVAGK